MRSLRLRFGGVSISPLGLGLAIGLPSLAALLLTETILGRWPAIAEAARAGPLSRQGAGILRDLRIAVVHCLMAGYLPAAFLAVVQGGRRTVLELQDALDCTAEECERLARSVRFRVPGLVAAVAIGLFFAFAGPYVTPPVPDDLWNPTTWGVEVIWHRVLGPFVAVWGALLAWAVVVISRRMSSLASELKSIDLFDLEPLMPFTRQGLRNALLGLGFIAIAGLMVLTETGFGLLGIGIGLPVLTVAALSFLLPLRGVHRRIRTEKERELAAVEARLRDLRDAVVGGMADSVPSRENAGSFADLSAYRELLRDVREWPVGRSSYVRLAAYLTIPVLSWALAAFVEHLLDSFVF